MKNRVLGSIFIVAGTTIGAGMLAMPLAAANVGFGVTFAMLVLLWSLMCYTALLLVEVYQHVEIGTDFGSVAQRYLGKKGRILTTLSMTFLMYALTAAYISGAGELFTVTLSSLFGSDLPAYSGVLLFTILGGGVVCIGTHSVDIINRILFTAKIIFLVVALTVMLPHVTYENLLSLPVSQGLTLAAIPLVFTSFGFHGSVPSIVQYLNFDTKKLHRVFIIGSFIPLAVYIFWQVVTLGSINPDIFAAILQNNSGLNGMLDAVRNVTNTPMIGMVLRRFADLALATSFLGVALGLFDYLAGLFRRENNISGRLQTGLLTFIPPLIFSLFYPKGFIIALGYAAIALSVLALLLPTMLVWQTRKKHDAKYRVLGGKPALIVVFGVGISIILIQLAIVFELLPSVG